MKSIESRFLRSSDWARKNKNGKGKGKSSIELVSFKIG